MFQAANVSNNHVRGMTSSHILFNEVFYLHVNYVYKQVSFLIKLKFISNSATV